MVKRKDKYKNDMKIKLLDNRSATQSIKNAKTNNKPANDFIEITGIKSSNFTSINPPALKQQIEMFMGNGTATIVLRKD